MWDNAWADAIQLASAAWTVLTGRRNEPLAWSYWHGITTLERKIVESTFRLAAHSDSLGPGNRFHFCCGDFMQGDESTSGIPVFDSSTTCDNPEVNGYCRWFISPGAPFSTATNDIAACGMLNPVKTGRIVMKPDPAVKQKFCDETDIPHLHPSTIGIHRRSYFRGWILLHELTHTYSVGYNIISQGPGQHALHLGTSDYEYSQLGIAHLDGSTSVLNAQSYSNFAWDAFFWLTCGRMPQNMLGTLGP